jgi:hypothetical protein
MIAEGVTTTKIQRGSDWVYGPFQSTKAIRTWLFNQTGINPHLDQRADGRAFLRLGKELVGEQTRDNDGLVYVTSRSSRLKAPPELPKKWAKSTAAVPTASPAPSQPAAEKPTAPEVQTAQQPDPEVDNVWAAKSEELKKVVGELNTHLEKIRRTFAFHPETETDTDEYRRFLAKLMRDPSQHFTSRQRTVIGRYGAIIDALEEREDALSSELAELEVSMGGTGIDAYDIAVKSPATASEVDPAHQKVFTQRLDTALTGHKEKVKKQVRKGDLVEFPNESRAEVMRVTDRTMTVQFGGRRLEDVPLDAEFKVIPQGE